MLRTKQVPNNEIHNIFHILNLLQDFKSLWENTEGEKGIRKAIFLFSCYYSVFVRKSTVAANPQLLWLQPLMVSEGILTLMTSDFQNCSFKVLKHKLVVVLSIMNHIWFPLFIKTFIFWKLFQPAPASCFLHQIHWILQTSARRALYPLQTQQKTKFFPDLLISELLDSCTHPCPHSALPHAVFMIFISPCPTSLRRYPWDPDGFFNLGRLI